MISHGKTVFSILLFSLFGHLTQGQVAIQNDLQNIAYVALPNPLTVAANGINPMNIVLATNNGEIRQDNSDRNWKCNYWPSAPGMAKVYVKKKLPDSRLVTIDSTLFLVKNIPLPYATLAGARGGNISQELLMVQIAPSANFQEVCGRASIISFNIDVFRKGKNVFRRTLSDPHGTRIDSATKEFFYQLRNNDNVVFSKITIKNFDKKTTVIEPIEFTITDAHKYRKVFKDEPITLFDPVTGNEYQKIIHYQFVRDDE
jgi:GldM C-terminal domain